MSCSIFSDANSNVAVEQSWDSEKESEETLDSANESDSDIKKSMDLENASIIKKKLDLNKDIGPEKLVFPKNDWIENISAFVEEIPASVPDTLPSSSGFKADAIPMQISSEPATVVEVAHPIQINGSKLLL